ncbi:ATPase inhibitor [Zea mays]|uniref:ATPase inhibitor n=1 Tax=Zea mays TaxID=4577 RepID=A0A1D6H9Y7_MAIZE|nr:ATPase inhibitor [Zea mays]AQK71521.1 ATPase inhibitor [Zea mays]
MATRRTVAASVTAQRPAWAAVARRMEGVSRYFSDKASGRLLSEEERAAENVYIQKMEREKLEKLRRKEDKAKAEAAKRAAAAARGDTKNGEEAHPS